MLDFRIEIFSFVSLTKQIHVQSLTTYYLLLTTYYLLLNTKDSILTTTNTVQGKAHLNLGKNKYLQANLKFSF